MRSSTSFFNKGALLLFTALLSLSACVTLEEKGNGDFREKPRIVVFPVENLGGTGAPLKEIRGLMIERLRKKGIPVVEDEVLEKFMARHRIRYTGGIDRATAQALRTETGAEAVLIASLELYSPSLFPKIALTSRLVSTGANPSILWIDGTGLAGDRSPGILGLGLIDDPDTLVKKALDLLTGSLSASLSAQGKKVEANGPKRRFQAKTFYQSGEIRPDSQYAVAVLPFFNRSDRKGAGEIMALHFIKHLKAVENVEVVEPGILRQELLGLRMIMDEGISLGDASAVLSLLNADLILTGKVIDYQDYQGIFGKPKVDFSMLVIEKESLKVVWSSDSYNEGDDGVFFFDRGKVHTAHEMASQMVLWIRERWQK